MSRPRILSNPAVRYHGKPCKFGHTERYRSTKTCVECTRTLKAALYQKNGRRSRTKNFPDRPKLCGNGCSPTPHPPESFYKTKYGTLSTDCKTCLKAYKAEMWRIKYKTLGKPIESVLT